MLEIFFKVIEMECISIFFKHPQEFSNTLSGLKRESKCLSIFWGGNRMLHAALQSLNRNTERTIRYYICLVSAELANK